MCIVSLSFLMCILCSCKAFWFQRFVFFSFCRFIFDVSMIWSLSSCSGTKKCLSLFILASYLVQQIDLFEVIHLQMSLNLEV
jgi:hypothetical protein